MKEKVLSANSKDELRKEIDIKFDAYIKRFYKEVPYASQQKDGEGINMEFYKRHSIETPIRIKLKRTVDALVIHYFTKVNPKAAKDWAHYTDDEMLHGHMFAKDIERLWGLSYEEVISTEPLLSTKLLNGYFYYNFEYEGPMAAIASAYFLEFVTSKTQPVWLDNMEKLVGFENVKGARAHVNHDLDEDHSSFVWDTLMETVHTAHDVEKLENHFSAIYGLFCSYMTEVYNMTVLNDKKTLDKVAVDSVNYATCA
jgi:hypothetical protein